MNEKSGMFRLYLSAWVYYAWLRVRGYRNAKAPRRMSVHWRHYWLVECFL